MSALPGIERLPRESYPGFPDHAGEGYEPMTPFGDGDNGALWLLDFHAGDGLTALGTEVVQSAARGSQVAADALPVPGTRGLGGRFAWSHPYYASIPDDDEERSRRGAVAIPEFLRDAETAWARESGWLDHDYARARADGSLAAALAHMDRAWEIHFGFMYPLIGGYFAFIDFAGRLGLDESLAPILLQGYATRLTATDAALWDLARVAARDDGTFDDALAGFLAVHGARTDAIYDVAPPPWEEDPEPVLERVRALAELVGDASYDDVLRESVQRREEAERTALDALTTSEQEQFRGALDDVRRANFAVWNEEHNVLIDLRVHLPLRAAALSAARRAGMDEPSDAFHLFRAELLALEAGELDPRAAAELAAPRRALHERWARDRSELPVVAGTAPPSVDDPILREIFGITDESLATLAGGGGEGTTTLRGMPVAAGVARGRARVLQSPSELGRIEPGEVLVCNATTPAWTPAFASLAACVCDLGGSLTHAAIVSREYGIACVTGTGVATRTISTGDLLEVDGARGVVRILS